ncbi:MAG TPA: proton-conducting transporter membrane subunit [Methanospirillum sp.]|nr:proton-conducting transporter membrane subunit [Methanospirillum sp.]
MIEYFALVPILSPVVGAVIVYLLLQFSEPIQKAFILGCMFILFILDFSYLIALLYGMTEVVSLGPIVLDASGMFIASLVTFLGTLVLCYSFIFRKKTEFDSTFFIIYFLLAGMMCGMACTYNVLVMLVFLEAATITSAFLILYGRTKRAIKATYIYLGISIVEVIFVIYGAFILYTCTGTLDLRLVDISRIAPDTIFLLGLLFLFGFGTKAGILPLSAIWLPPAHADAPAPVSATMSGILIKSGLIGMVKVMYPLFVLSGVDTLILIVLFIATLNMVLGGIMAFFAQNIKRLLAWSSISQIGYIILGFGFATPVAIYGSLFHILNHLLFKGSLFLIAGVLLFQVKTLRIHKMGGLLRFMPMTGLCFLIASLAMSGVPFLNGFISKEIIYEGSVEAGFPVLLSIFGLDLTIFGIIGWIVSIIIFICLMRAFYLIFLGEPKESFSGLQDPPFSTMLPILILVGLCILIGFFPDLVSGSLQKIAETIYQMRG